MPETVQDCQDILCLATKYTNVKPKLVISVTINKSAHLSLELR